MLLNCFNHQNKSQNLGFSPNRLTYKFTESLKAGWGKTVSVSKSAWRIGKLLTLPARLPLMPVWWLFKKAGQGLETGSRYAHASAFAAVEGGRTLIRDAIGKPLWTLARTPLVNIKRNLVDNTREILKGMFRLPINLLRTPGAMVKSGRESVSNLFRGGRNLLTFQGNFWNSIKGVSLRHPIRSSRAIVGSVLGGVGEVLVPRTARDHLRACLETPYNVSRNIVTSQTQYFQAIPESFRQFRSGIRNIPGATRQGWEKGKGINWIEILRKKKEEAKKAAEAAAQEVAKKQVQKAGGISPPTAKAA